MNSLPNSFPGSFPGSRTSPTVKQSAHGNQRGLRRWQVNLSAVQSMILLGVATGGMACAFYLGFFAGQKVGLETALNNNLATALRIPIAGVEENTQPPADEELADVYAKLQALDSSLPSPIKESEGAAAVGASLGSLRAKPVPELGEIKSADAAPPAEMLAVPDSRQANNPIQVESAPLPENADVAAIRRAVESAESELRALETGKAVAPPAPAAEAPIQVAALQEPPKPQVRVLGAADSHKSAEAPAAPVAVQKAEEPAEKAVVAKANVKPAEQKLQQKPPAVEKPQAAPVRGNENFIRQTLPKGWFAQIAAPDKQAEAEGIARKLKAAGFPVIIENATVRGQQYFRVLVGPESTRQQADRLLVQLKREPGIKGDPFIRMVR